MLRTAFVFLVFNLFLFAACDEAFAGREVIYDPVIIVPNLQISTSKAAVKKSIRRQFPISEIQQETDNSFRFLFTIRSHSADIAVHFTETSIQFEFLSCENLDYKVKNGRRLIHENYNLWMRDLAAELELELEFSDDTGSDDTGSDDIGSEQVAKVDRPDPGVMEGDTQIYVFRQKSMVGAIMTVSVGINERLVAQLKSSTYCMVTEKAGLITVNLLQAGRSIAFVNVDNRPGKSVYLNFDYKRGTLTQIARSRGLELLKKYKKMPNLTIHKPNPAYVSR